MSKGISMRNRCIWRPPGAERGLIIAATEAILSMGWTPRPATSSGGPASAIRFLGRRLPCGNIDPLGITGTPVIDSCAARSISMRWSTIVARRGTSSMACGSPTAACCPAFRSMLPQGSPRAASASSPAGSGPARRACLAEWPDLRPVRRPLRRLWRLSWRCCRPWRRSTAALGRVGNASSEGRDLGARGIERGRRIALLSRRAIPRGARSWQDGEGVFRVGPDLAHTIDPRRVFAPGNWQQLDDDDLDLGGVHADTAGLPAARCRSCWRWGRMAMPICLTARSGWRRRRGALTRAARGAIITAPAVYPMGGAVLVAFQARGLHLPRRILCVGHRRARGHRRSPYGYPLLGALGWTAGARRLSQPRTATLNRLSGLPARRAMTDCTASAAIPVKRYTGGRCG